MEGEADVEKEKTRLVLLLVVAAVAAVAAVVVLVLVVNFVESKSRRSREEKNGSKVRDLAKRDKERKDTFQNDEKDQRRQHCLKLVAGTVSNQELFYPRISWFLELEMQMDDGMNTGEVNFLF